MIFLILKPVFMRMVDLVPTKESLEIFSVICFVTAYKKLKLTH